MDGSRSDAEVALDCSHLPICSLLGLDPHADSGEDPAPPELLVDKRHRSRARANTSGWQQTQTAQVDAASPQDAEAVTCISVAAGNEFSHWAHP
jgi:hypothetical protein